MHSLLRFFLCYITSYYLTTLTTLPLPNVYLLTPLLFLLQLTLTTLYNAVLYPRFFSPLRHIPTPPGAHWLSGHTRKIMKEPSGYPAREWMGTVENQGLIRYSNWGRERVVPTTPAALGMFRLCNIGRLLCLLQNGRSRSRTVSMMATSTNISRNHSRSTRHEKLRLCQACTAPPWARPHPWEWHPSS
jgi:hypothetical protein